MGRAYREPREDRLSLTGDLHSMLHVAVRLRLGERPHVIARRHALGQLAQVRSRQVVGQLGLADQDDLKQLLLRRLQIGQETDLLQHARAQVLGLVDDQHGAPAARVSVEQGAGERVDQHLEARRPCRVLDLELVAHEADHLDRGESGIEDHGDVDVDRQLLQQRAADDGLPGAHLARQHDEAPTLADPVEQVGQRLAVDVAEIEVARIRCKRERPLGEPEVLGVHSLASVEARERRCPRQAIAWSICSIESIPPGFSSAMTPLLDQDPEVHGAGHCALRRTSS